MWIKVLENGSFSLYRPRDVESFVKLDKREGSITVAVRTDDGGLAEIILTEIEVDERWKAFNLKQRQQLKALGYEEKENREETVKELWDWLNTSDKFST